MTKEEAQMQEQELAQQMQQLQAGKTQAYVQAYTAICKEHGFKMVPVTTIIGNAIQQVIEPAPL